MLTKILKILDTTNRTSRADLVSELSKKKMTKVVQCTFKQPFRLFKMLTVHQFSDMGRLSHLRNHAFCSIWFRKQLTFEAHVFFQSVSNFMLIQEMQRKIEEIFFDLEIIAFQLVALDSRFYWERILVIVLFSVV